MKHLTLSAGLLVLLSGLTLAMTAQAQQPSTGPDKAAQQPANERSNRGGAVRGLDRADQVAGEHGAQGRERARAAQQDRPNRAEKPERPQRPGR